MTARATAGPEPRRLTTRTRSPRSASIPATRLPITPAPTTRTDSPIGTSLRYFSSRDELLTRLIIDAYDSLGAAAEAREAAVGRDDLAGRFTAICAAVRTWALAHPNEYALIYGSPVPGYAAPADTVRAASRVTTLLLRIIVEAAAAGRVPDAGDRDAEAQPVAAALAPIRSYLPPGIPAPFVQRALMVWTNLFGVVSFELFGQLHNVVGEDPADRDAFFAACVRRWITFTPIT